VLIVFVLSAWPLVEPAPSGTSTREKVWSFLGIYSWKVTPDTALLLLVVAVSMLGSFIHAATSFATYAGNRRLYSSWVWWYLLRAAIGASLALIVYFVVRGGLFSGTATSESLNPYGIAGIAGLSGLFSKQATDKLREIFDTVLATTGRVGDAERADKVTNPAPVLDSISPEEVPASAGRTRVTLEGSGFIAQSVIRVHHVHQPERVLELPVESMTERGAIVYLPADLLSAIGALELLIQNPAPGGGESEPRTLVVTPTPTADAEGGRGN
jgi:hypothetical protein